VFNDDWEAHLVSLDKVLQILQDSNFTVNPLKCEWGVKETDWLGYWLTPTGLKPWKKKVDAILALERPKTAKQLRSFLGAINFYRDMYPRRSHVLAPLTAMSGIRKGTIPWDDACQKAFDHMKALLAQDVFLRYPDHNKPFHVYTDASDYQLGAAIMQDGAPVAYYSRKLNAAQKNYTVGEKELLSVVETLREFRTMLYGCQNIHVYTDHKNNTFQKFQTQRVLRWRLFLEDYGIHLHYVKGDDNNLADALSRLDSLEKQSTSEPISSEVNFEPQSSESNFYSSTQQQHFYSMAIDDDNLLDCFIHLHSNEDVPFVMDYQLISEKQVGDARLAKLRQDSPHKVANQLLAPDTTVACYMPSANAPWKIYLPDALLHDAIRWYHCALGHIGQNRLHDTMKIHLYHPDLRNKIEDFVSRCDPCQRQKNVGRGHGYTAGRDAHVHPWREVCVDLIGPWKLTISGESMSFHALTIIDPVTNLTELVRIDNKTSPHVALMFENTWLSRYPKPMHCIYDQGGEFTGYAFQQVLERHRIKRHPTSSKNPQANSICERMHQTVGNSLRAMATLKPPDGMAAANQLVDTALANCVFALRATLNSSINATPGSLAFGRDMILDLPLIADWNIIQENRQQLIDKRLIEANRKRFAYDYSIGDKVLKLAFKPDKLSARAHGPYEILNVHTNGTVTIRLNSTTIERISIRRIKPYHE